MRSVRLALVLAIVMIAGFVISGCGSDDDKAASDGGTTQSTSTQAKEEPTVGVALPDLASFQGVYKSIYEGMEATAAEKGIKLDLSTTTGTFSPQAYQNAIDTVVARGVKVVTFDAYDPKLFGPVVERLQAKGVKVVTMNPKVANETANVVMDTKGAVEATVKVMVEALGGKGKVGLITAPSIGIVAERVKYAKAALEAAGVTIVGQAGVDCSLVKGANATQDLLQAHPDMNAIFTGCGQPGIGAAKSVQQSGKDVMVFTYDGSDDELKAVKAGTITGTLRQRFSAIGEQVAEVLAAIAKGEPVEQTYTTSGYDVVTKDNIDEFLK